jgi:cyanophycin synthetase
LNGLSPNTLRFALSARARDIPVQVSKGILQLGWSCHARKLLSSFTDATSTIATGLARSKIHTNFILSQNAVPVPTCLKVTTPEAALNAAKRLGWPVVIKPASLDQGMGVVPGIRDKDTLIQAFEAAQKLSPGDVLLEQHVEGHDYRLLVVGGKLLMATHRIPAGVVGDGHSNVSTLIAHVNKDPRRGTKFRSLLVRLSLDEKAQQCLAEQGLCAESIPLAGQFVRLRMTASIGTGATPEDVTTRIHPDNRMLAERAARLIGLDIAGVDFLCPDISKSWREVGGAINEVNSQPGFRPHWLGDPSRDINGEILDWMFRDRPARIPTVAITGTNGKSTVAKMLHHIWMYSGKQAGVCTTAGVWVGEALITQDNLSGYPGGRLLLDDPLVEVAVIEMPRKGLLYFGHPCDHYDVAALLNVQNDHIGVDGINSLEEMAVLKAEVLARARQAVVVNAEDPLCLASLVHAGTGRHVLVAMSGNVQALQDHLVHKKGEAVFIAEHAGERYVVLAQGSTHTPLMPIDAIPATMRGLLVFNESNALFAIALAWAQGLSIATIRAAMERFGNTPEQNPGRYNLVTDFPFKVLLDYGHNPEGINQLCEIALNIPTDGARVLLNLKIGNRHRAHFTEIAPILAKTFNRFILGCDADFVKRSGDYLGADPERIMLQACQEALAKAGVHAESMVTERGYHDAIRLALRSAKPGDLLVLLAEPWEALPILEEMKKARSTQ